MALSSLTHFGSANNKPQLGFSENASNKLASYLQNAETEKNIFIPRSSFLVNMRGGAESLKLNAASIFKSKPKYESNESLKKRTSSYFHNQASPEKQAKPENLEQELIKFLRRARVTLSSDDHVRFEWAFKHYPQVRQFFQNTTVDQIALNVDVEKAQGQSEPQKELADHISNLLDTIEPSDVSIDPESHDGSIRLKALSSDLSSFLKDAQVKDVKALFKAWKPFLEDHDLQKDIASALSKGTLDKLGKTESYSTAVFSVVSQGDDGLKVETKNEFAHKLLSQLLKDTPDIHLPTDGAAVVLKVRDPKKFKETYERVINHFRVGNKVPVKQTQLFQDAYDALKKRALGHQTDPRQAALAPEKYEAKHIKESHAYSFIESLITKGTQEAEKLNRADDKDNLSTQDCLNEFLDSAVCEFESDNKDLEAFLNHELKHNQKDLKAALAATQALSLHYAEQVELKEVMFSLSLGALIGGGGEVAIEKLLHDLPPGAKTGLRMLLFAVVDFVDNSLGELGTLNADLSGMGLKLSKKDIFNIEGSLTFLQKCVKYPGMALDLLAKGDAPGAAGLPVGIALRAATTAALMGIALNYWPATVYSDEHASIGKLMAATILSVGGTSLSIPLNLLFTFPRSMAAVNDHMQQGRIEVSDEIKDLVEISLQDFNKLAEAPENISEAKFNDLVQKAEASLARANKKLDSFQYTQALHDLDARIGFSASINAFSSIGILATAWLAMHAGAKREVLQPIVMALSPAMENLLRFVYTSATAYRFPNKVRGISNAVIDAAQQGHKVTPTALMKMATAAPTRALTRLWENMTYPAQRLMTVRGSMVSMARPYPNLRIEENPPPVKAAEYMTGIETLASKGVDVILRRQPKEASANTAV